MRTSSTITSQPDGLAFSPQFLLQSDRIRDWQATRQRNEGQVDPELPTKTRAEKRATKILTKKRVPKMRYRNRRHQWLQKIVRLVRTFRLAYREQAAPGRI